MPVNGEPSQGESGVNENFFDTFSCTKVDTIKLRHTWTINNFSYCIERNEKFIQSTTFSAEGSGDKSQWIIKVHPNGENTKHKDYVSIFLNRVKCMVPEVTAKVKLSIVNASNSKTVCRVYTQTFGPNVFTWGYPNFILRDKLLNSASQLLPDDKLTILCEMSIVTDIRTISEKSHAIAFEVLKSQTLIHDMGFLMEKHPFSDVTLTVSGKEYQSHKAILAARSPIFLAMFENDMQESNLGKVEIIDIDHNVFVELLRFIYTDEVMNLETMATELIAAADKYALHPLKLMCVKALYKNLKIENAVDILILANLHNADQLKPPAIDFICAHAHAITNTAAFETMVKSYPLLAVELFRALSSRNNENLNTSESITNVEKPSQ